MVRLTTRDSADRFAEVLAARVSFRTAGALRGECGPVVPDRGRLTDEAEWARIKAGVEYVVYSYATPVAWLWGGVWEVTGESYSQTTARHISKIRTAVALMEGASR